MLPSCLFMVHDSSRCGEDDISELSAGQEIVGPLFNFSDGNIKPWGDDTTFVESTIQINNNLASTMIINDLSKR